MRRRVLHTLAAFSLLATASPGASQDSNILLPSPVIEGRFRSDPFEVVWSKPSRGIPGERTHQVVFAYEDGTQIKAKWAPAPRGGSAFNNEPRLEVAAYEVQKLFLDESEYVVPPTVARCVPIDEYPQLDEADARIRPTFNGWDVVVVVLQYWLWDVDGGAEARELIDWDRFDQDPEYARHAANFNLLTYLIRHRDSNQGNFLRSKDPGHPRLFSIDNGIAFESMGESDRGNYWERIRVPGLPRTSIERLRSLGQEDLRRALGVVAEFQEHESAGIVSVQPTANLSPEEGIRRQGRVLQLGLTDFEIRRLYDRIQRLLRDVDRGRLEVF